MKNALIIVLIVIILILGGIWGYLFLNGAPKSLSDVGDNVFGTSPAVVPVATDTEVTPGPVDSGASRTVKTDAILAKLTTRAVAGAMISTSSVDTFIRYAEKGTGYIFEIDLKTGTEIRISNKVIARAVEAYWSPTGNHVVFITDAQGKRDETLLGTLSIKKDTKETVLDTESIAQGSNIAFTRNGKELLYTETNPSGGTTSFSRTLATGDTKTLFTVPFAESTVLWDLWGTSAHYVYTKPALGFNGYLYKVTKGGLEKIDEASALSAARLGTSTLIINKNSGKGPYSLLVDTVKNNGIFLNIQTLSEKCAKIGISIWCGSDAAANSNTFPISWYQGEVSYADLIWNVDSMTGEGSIAVDPEAFIREQIDVTDMMTSDEGPLIFRNKRDDTLWIFNPPK